MPCRTATYLTVTWSGEERPCDARTGSRHGWLRRHHLRLREGRGEERQEHHDPQHEKRETIGAGCVKDESTGVGACRGRDLMDYKAHAQDASSACGPDEL